MDTFNVELYAAMFGHDVPAFVSNVQTRLEVWHAGPHAFPVSINDAEWENSYVCSPFTHYITCASEECEKLGKPALRSGLRLFLRVLGGWLRRADINRCVHINNFLLSTNLYPDWDGTGAEELLRRARTSHPSHAIVFRSLNRTLNQPLIRALQGLGCQLLPTRRVWLLDGANDAQVTGRTDFANDARLFPASGLRRVAHEEFRDADLVRAEALYRMLYLEKYSVHNPQFTAAFLRHCHQHNLFHFHGLRDARGALVGVAGGFRRGRVITNSIFGYDTSLPRELGLYRILSHLVIREAVDRGWLLNLSAGAGQFKRTRGGCPEIEYSAVFDQHLPAARRRPWRFLRWVSEYIAVPLIEKHDL
jgi:hypothetical protein